MLNQTATSRGKRYSAFIFTISAEYASAQEVASVLSTFATVEESVIATHDRDSVAPHIQGAFSGRLTIHEAALRFAALKLPAGALSIRPLVRGKGYGREPIVGYGHYLTHSDPEHQTRGRVYYPRTSMIVSSATFWDRVDAWLDVRQRAEARAGCRPAPYTERVTLRRLVEHDLVSLGVVRTLVPALYGEHFTTLERSVRKLHDVPLPEPDRARLAQPLADTLLAEQHRRDYAAAAERAAQVEAQEQAQEAAGVRQIRDDERLAEEKAKQEQHAREATAERQAHRAQQHASPIYQAQLAEVRAKEELNGLVIFIAGQVNVGVTPHRRESAVRRAVAEEAGLDATDVDLWEWACNEVNGDRAAVEKEISETLRDLRAIPGQIAAAEMHAVDGNDGALARARSLRTTIAPFSDIATAPIPRTDLSKKQLAFLLAA